jgi:hypothetical protein
MRGCVTDRTLQIRRRSEVESAPPQDHEATVLRGKVGESECDAAARKRSTTQGPPVLTASLGTRRVTLEGASFVEDSNSADPVSASSRCSRL